LPSKIDPGAPRMVTPAPPSVIGFRVEELV